MFTQRLTIAVMVVWVVSLGVRVALPASTQAFLGLDAVVLVVIGYYFSNTAIIKRRNRNGLSG